MRTRLLGMCVVLALAIGMSSSASAITFGEPDLNNQYPNVASVRGIVAAQNLARISCSGSLLHRDAQKVVILTAAHCTDGWIAAIAGRGGMSYQSFLEHRREFGLHPTKPDL